LLGHVGCLSTEHGLSGFGGFRPEGPPAPACTELAFGVPWWARCRISPAGSNPCDPCCRGQFPELRVLLPHPENSSGCLTSIWPLDVGVLSRLPFPWFRRRSGNSWRRDVTEECRVRRPSAGVRVLRLAVWVHRCSAVFAPPGGSKLRPMRRKPAAPAEPIPNPPARPAHNSRVIPPAVSCNAPVDCRAGRQLGSVLPRSNGTFRPHWGLDWGSVGVGSGGC